MRRMRSMALTSALLVALLVTSCAPGTDREQAQAEAEALYRETVAQFLRQTRYTFTGTTTLQRNQTLHDLARVRFNGYVDSGDEVWVRLSLTGDGGTVRQEEVLSLYQLGDRFYSRLADSRPWKASPEKDRLIRNELAYWNPADLVRAIDAMKVRVTVDPRRSTSDVRALAVAVNPDELKRWLSERVRDLAAEGRHPDALVFSGAELLMREEVASRKEKEQSRQAMADRLNTLEASGAFTLFVDVHRRLPTKIEGRIQAQYREKGQTVRESTTLNVFLSDYGEAIDRPRDLPATPLSQERAPRPLRGGGDPS